MARIKKDNSEGFEEMVIRMEAEGDHGLITKDNWDELKNKWMEIYYSIKNSERNPLLLSWEDIERINRHG